MADRLDEQLLDETLQRSQKVTAQGRFIPAEEAPDMEYVNHAAETESNAWSDYEEDRRMPVTIIDPATGARRVVSYEQARRETLWRNIND